MARQAGSRHRRGHHVGGRYRQAQQRGYLDHDGPPTSALKPLMGWSLQIFSPSVRIRRKERTER